MFNKDLISIDKDFFTIYSIDIYFYVTANHEPRPYLADLYLSTNQPNLNQILRFEY